MITYRDLLKQLQTLTDKQLDEKVEVCNTDEEFFTLDNKEPWILSSDEDSKEFGNFSAFTLYLEYDGGAGSYDYE